LVTTRCLPTIFKIILFIFHGYAAIHDLHSFPTRRSSDLTRPCAGMTLTRGSRTLPARISAANSGGYRRSPTATRQPMSEILAGKDRKSTRLNSSHVKISYAVFCLKKKNTTKKEQQLTSSR